MLKCLDINFGITQNDDDDDDDNTSQDNKNDKYTQIDNDRTFQVPIYSLLDEYPEFLRTIFRKLTHPGSQPRRGFFKLANSLLFGLFANFHFLRAKYRLSDTLEKYKNVLNSKQRVPTSYFDNYRPPLNRRFLNGETITTVWVESNVEFV